MTTAGADACRLGKKRKGWAIVELEEGRFRAARFVESLRSYLEESAVDLVAVDIPVGLRDEGRRPADVEAKEFIGDRRSSVFYTPTRKAIEAVSIAQARQLEPSLSAQSYGLRDKILEVDKLLGGPLGQKIVEFHPEVSFRALASRDLDRKRTWNGQVQRRTLLRSGGAELPGEIHGDAGQIPPHDILDAAVGALTARAVLQGTAEYLPRGIDADRSTRGVMWYPVG